jgi:hypothetical protein
MRDDNTPQQPRSFNLTEPVAIVLTLGQWNSILQLLTKAPWDVADPMIQALREQIAGVLVPREARRNPNVGPEPNTMPAAVPVA